MKLTRKIRARRFVAALFLVLIILVLTQHLFSMNSSAAKTVSTDGKQPDMPQEIRRLAVDGYVNAVSWNFDGTKLAVLSDYGSKLSSWNTHDWKFLGTFKQPLAGYDFNSLGFLSGDNLLTTATAPDPESAGQKVFSLYQWNVETGQRLRKIPEQGMSPEEAKSSGIINTYTVSPDKSRIAGVTPNGAVIYDAQTGLPILQLKLPTVNNKLGSAQSLAFSPDGKELAVGAFWGMVYFFDMQKGAIIRSIQAFDPDWYNCSAVAYSRDGKYLAVGRYSDMSGQLLNNIWVNRLPDMVAIKIWSNDGKLVAALPGSVWQKVNGGDDAVIVRSLSWDPIKDVLAVGDDVSLRLWQFSDNKPIEILNKPIPKGAYSVSFSPDGSLAASDKNSVVIYR